MQKAMISNLVLLYHADEEDLPADTQVVTIVDFPSSENRICYNINVREWNDPQQVTFITVSKGKTDYLLPLCLSKTFLNNNLLRVGQFSINNITGPPEHMQFSNFMDAFNKVHGEGISLLANILIVKSEDK